MKAVTVVPLKQNSLSVREVEEPSPKRNELLLRVQRVGICGTDMDIISGFYGEAPKGSDFLILGHESLSRVLETGQDVRGFKKGDLVVPTVRRNCVENCLNCRNGESDMCLTGHYTEHGIKGLHGFAREKAITDWRFVAKMPEALSDVGVLLEPLTIVEKGLRQIYLMQQSRMRWRPERALVLGAGPVGLLAVALLRLGGLEVDAVATRSEESLKAKTVRLMSARYMDAKKTPVTSLASEYDIVLECTGNTSVALQAQSLSRSNGVVSYLGIYGPKVESQDAGKVFTNLVLGNKVHFGSVNANISYFRRGAKDLVKISRRWKGILERMITRRIMLTSAEEAYQPKGGEEIKTVIEFG